MRELLDNDPQLKNSYVYEVLLWLEKEQKLNVRDAMQQKFIEQVEIKMRNMLFEKLSSAVRIIFNTHLERIETLREQTVHGMTVKEWLDYLLSTHDIRPIQYIGYYDRPYKECKGSMPIVLYLDSDGRILQMELNTTHSYEISTAWTEQHFINGLNKEILISAGKGVLIGGDAPGIIKGSFKRYKGSPMYSN